MSNNQIQSENHYFRHFRIIFYGRPFELERLVVDKKCIILNDTEFNKIVKAYNLFNGYKYLGSVLSFLTFTCLVYAPKLKIDLIKKTSLSLIPFVAMNIYSYFSYWHLIVDIVKETRRRYKQGYLKENQKIIQNLSDDYHEKIKDNIGFFNGINTVFYEINKEKNK